MPTLSVLDLAMFLLETQERPLNVGPLAIFTPPEGFRGNFANKLRQRMLARPIGEPFNYRLRTSVLGVPSLEVDPDADASKHVFRLTLDGAADMDQLCATVCKLHEVRVDRRGLLWEVHIIDGLEGGKVAVYGKVHHGIIDGRTFVEVVSNWLSTSATDKTVRAMWEGVTRRPRTNHGRPSLAELVDSTIRQTTGAAKTAMGLYRMVAKQALAKVGRDAAMTVPILDVPKVFQGEAVAQREFSFCTLPMQQVKTVAKANGASVNDVLLAVVDAAMARVLSDSGTLPPQPLVVDMPMALKNANGGNQIAVLQFPMGAPHSSPLERLHAVRSQAGRVKDLLLEESSSTLILYTTLLHGAPAILERLGAGKGIRLSNVMVSNPFGLPEERFLMGARVELALPMSVVTPGQMLNVTAVTLADQFQLGFLAVARTVPGFEKLAPYTQEAFLEMTSQNIQSKPKSKSKTTRKTTP